MSKDRKAGIYDFPNEKYPRTFQSLFELIEHDTKTKLPDSSRSAIQEYFGYRHQERTTLEKQKQTAKGKIEKKEQKLMPLEKNYIFLEEQLNQAYRHLEKARNRINDELIV